jgi:hypothetical protein
MTTNAVTLFDNGAAGLPAHLADINATGNIEVRDVVDTLSFRGKVWRINVGGIENIARKADGEPVSSLQMVVLDYNKARSRALYPKYVEGQSKPPICWSNDGVTPDNDVQTKQGEACQTCPMSQKGSKMNDDGQPGVACAQFKRAIVVPAGVPSFAPLLLKIPQTSMYDKDNKENEARGCYAFDQYMEMLKTRGVNNTAAVITKMTFDSRTSYPKLLFQAATWLPPEKAAAIKEQLANKEKLEAMLKIVDVSTPSAVAPAPEEYAPPVAAAPAPAPVAAAPAPAPAAAAPKPAPAVKPRPAKPAAAPAPAPAAVAPAGDDDDGVQFIPAGQAAPAVAAAKPAAQAGQPAADTTPASAGNALAALVTGWDTE